MNAFRQRRDELQKEKDSIQARNSQLREILSKVENDKTLKDFSEVKGRGDTIDRLLEIRRKET